MAKTRFSTRSLLNACRFGRLDHVQYLLEVCKEDPNQTDDRGSTALHMACKAGHVNCVSFLLEKGAKPNLQDFQGNTPLHNACEAQAEECISALLHYGEVDSDIQNFYNETPLFLIAELGNEKCVDILLEAGEADADMPCEHDQTPLFIACAANDNLRCASVLLHAGADPMKPTIEGKTALDVIREKHGETEARKVFHLFEKLTKCREVCPDEMMVDEIS